MGVLKVIDDGYNSYKKASSQEPDIIYLSQELRDKLEGELASKTRPTDKGIKFNNAMIEVDPALKGEEMRFKIKGKLSASDTHKRP